MIDISSLLRLGKTIKLIGGNDACWEFGISKLVKDCEIICDLISNYKDIPPKDIPPVESDVDYKLAISQGSGVYMVPVKIEFADEDTGRFKFYVSKEYKFNQRREYYRLIDPGLEIDCKIHGEPYDAEALDLAGGGIGLYIERERPVKKDTLLELKIRLPDETTIRAGARASHIVPADEPNKYYVGAYFSRVTRADKAKIMKHIFCEQIIRSKEERIKQNTEESA